MAAFASSSAEIGFVRANMANARVPQVAASNAEKARAAAQDFEAVFVNSMFQQMFTAVDGEGPIGGGAGVGVWRSFLTDEYAKSFVKAGGVGIADHVYRALIAQQEARNR